MNKKKALLIGLVLVIVLLVGVLVGVLAGGGSRGGDPTPAAPSAPSTPVNTSMDDVVAGTGAIATSQTPGFEGVGTRYPATCVGAIQASAEWSQKVFGSTERRDVMLANNSQEMLSFLDEIGVVPGVLRLQSTVGEDFFGDMFSGKDREGNYPVVSPRVEAGVVQVIKCDPDSDYKTAVVRVAMPVDNPVGEAVGNAHVEFGWLVRTYELQVVDGSWRLVHLLDPRDQTNYQQMMNAGGMIDLDTEYPVLIQRPVTDEAREIVSRTLFASQGVHYFQNKNGEWGKAS